MDFGLFFFRFLSLVLASWITAQASSPRQSAERKPDVPEGSPFKLTLGIDKELCSTVPDVIDGWKRPHRLLTLDLRLHFTNQTRNVVRLDKDSVSLASHIVYASPFVGPSEILLPDDGMISYQGRTCPSVPSEKLMAIRPGEFYETTLKVKFEVVSEGRLPYPESLIPGEYFLTLTMGATYEIEGQNEELKAMRKKGIRFILPVTSEPLWFVVRSRLVKRRV